MRYTLFVLSILMFLSGCAQTYWVHPSKSPNQLQGDVATCQNEAMRSVPNVIAAPVAPVYVPPTQYSTNCSTMGIYTNCNTTAQPDNMARVMQQNAQNMAQAGSNLGTALTQKRYTENCMQAFGWSEQKMPATTSKSTEEYNDKYKAGYKALGLEYKEKVCKSERLKLIFTKTSCLVSETSISNTENIEKISSAEKIDFIYFDTAIEDLSNKEWSLIYSYILPPLRDEYLTFRRSQITEGVKLRLSLYDGHISWGEYNQRRLVMVGDHSKASQEFFKNRKN